MPSHCRRVIHTRCLKYAQPSFAKQGAMGSLVPGGVYGGCFVLFWRAVVQPAEDFTPCLMLLPELEVAKRRERIDSACSHKCYC